MNPLVQFIFMDVPEAFVILMTGFALYNESLLARWKKGIVFSLLYGTCILVLNSFQTPYEIQVFALFVLMNLFIHFLFKLPVSITILVSISAFVLMMMIEFLVILLFQLLHISINEIMAKPLYLYSAMWLIFLILLGIVAILRRFQFSLIRLFPFSKLNTYLSMLVICISAELLVMLSVTTRYYLANENQLDVITVHNIPILLLAMLILFIAIVLLFIRYLVLKKTMVEAETETPYLKSIENVVQAIRSVQNNESKHYQKILELLERKAYSEVSDYIEQIFQICGRDNKHFSKLVHAELIDPAVGYLLQTKLAYCQANQVTFTYEILSSHQFQHMKSIDTIKLLGNLLDNAIRAALEDETHHEVHLTWKSSEKDEILTIANTGPTIPREAIHKLFQLGYTTKQSNGGVGLSVVKSIVKKYRGHIEVTSENCLTTFQIIFPLQ